MCVCVVWEAPSSFLAAYLESHGQQDQGTCQSIAAQAGLLSEQHLRVLLALPMSVVELLGSHGFEVLPKLIVCRSDMSALPWLCSLPKLLHSCALCTTCPAQPVSCLAACPCPSRLPLTPTSPPCVCVVFCERVSVRVCIWELPSSICPFALCSLC